MQRLYLLMWTQNWPKSSSRSVKGNGENYFIKSNGYTCLRERKIDWKVGHVNTKLIEKLLSFIKENWEIYVKSNNCTCSRERKIDQKIALFVRGTREIYTEGALNFAACTIQSEAMNNRNRIGYIWSTNTKVDIMSSFPLCSICHPFLLCMVESHSVRTDPHSTWWWFC